MTSNTNSARATRSVASAGIEGDSMSTEQPLPTDLELLHSIPAADGSGLDVYHSQSADVYLYRIRTSEGLAADAYLSRLHVSEVGYAVAVRLHMTTPSEGTPIAH